MSKELTKVLFVTYFYPPIGGPGLPGAQRAVKFVKYLKNLEITVLTVKEDNHPWNTDFIKKLPINNETIKRTPFRNIFDYVLSMRQAVKKVLSVNKTSQGPTSQISSTESARPSDKNPSLWQRVKDYVYELCNFPDPASGWIIPAVIAGRRIIQGEKFGVILSTGMPWSALVVAWVLHRLSGVKLVVDFRDPWVGNPFHSSKGWFLDRLKCLLERRIVMDAALVSANTHVLRDEFVARYRGKVDTGKFIVVPNGFDPDDFMSLADVVPQRYEGTQSRLVLAHAGYLYGPRDPAPILEAIMHLERAGLASADSFRFVQMGNIHLQYDFHEQYKDLEQRGVIMDLGTRPFDECLKELLSADVLLLIQPGTKSQVPSKLYDYLCLNRPIMTVTPLAGALDDLIRENEFGDIFSPDDLPGIAARLGELLREKREKGFLTADYPHKHRFDISKVVSGLEQRIDSIHFPQDTA